VRNGADLLWADDGDLQGHQPTAIHSSTAFALWVGRPDSKRRTSMAGSFAAHLAWSVRRRQERGHHADLTNCWPTTESAKLSRSCVQITMRTKAPVTTGAKCNGTLGRSLGRYRYRYAQAHGFLMTRFVIGRLP
jgi:hypothetical protein